MPKKNVLTNPADLQYRQKAQRLSELVTPSSGHMKQMTHCLWRLAAVAKQVRPFARHNMAILLDKTDTEVPELEPQATYDFFFSPGSGVWWIRMMMMMTIIIAMVMMS